MINHSGNNMLAMIPITLLTSIAGIVNTTISQHINDLFALLKLNSGWLVWKSSVNLLKVAPNTSIYTSGVPYRVLKLNIYYITTIQMNPLAIPPTIASTHNKNSNIRLNYSTYVALLRLLWMHNWDCEVSLLLIVPGFIY